MTTKRPSSLPSGPVTTATAPPKRLEAFFYRTEAGNVPVIGWLGTLAPADRKLLGTDLRVVELTWPVPPPLVKKLNDPFWEIRDVISTGNQARILFAIDAPFAVVLHGFEKKSQKTPKSELNTAELRWKDYKLQKSRAARKQKE